MTVAAKPFGRRPRGVSLEESPAASLGAVLELLRALNWTIRAEVAWPTRAGRVFDYVVVGEQGIFAISAQPEDQEGIREAARELESLLGSAEVCPVVCSAVPLAEASDVLTCTPQTALDLLLGMPAQLDAAAARRLGGLLRTMEVPAPPEPEPVAEIEEADVSAPESTQVPCDPPPPRPGRHRSEKPSRLTSALKPPLPPDLSTRQETELEPITLALPSTLASSPTRVKDAPNPARRFDNDYVLPPQPARRSAVRREFRRGRFVMGLVVLIVMAAIAAIVAIMAPRWLGMIEPSTNPSATYGATIAAAGTNYHPALDLTVSDPQSVGSSLEGTSYAVTVMVTNVGSTPWSVPQNLFAMVDALGDSHPSSAIGGEIPRSLAGLRSWTGRVTFVLPQGRTPLRVQVALAAGGNQTATWK